VRYSECGNTPKAVALMAPMIAVTKFISGSHLWVTSNTHLDKLVNRTDDRVDKFSVMLRSWIFSVPARQVYDTEVEGPCLLGDLAIHGTIRGVDVVDEWLCGRGSYLGGQLRKIS
jgi:hypothetical protein